MVVGSVRHERESTRVRRQGSYRDRRDAGARGERGTPARAARSFGARDYRPQRRARRTGVQSLTRAWHEALVRGCGSRRLGRSLTGHPGGRRSIRQGGCTCKLRWQPGTGHDLGQYPGVLRPYVCRECARSLFFDARGIPDYASGKHPRDHRQRH